MFNMPKLECISNISESEVHNIIESVDTVLFDIDGVLSLSRVPIPGAENAVAKLRKLGKKIGFVTNNPMHSIDQLAQNLKEFGALPEEIVNPNNSLLTYLKKIDFKKDIYMIDCSVSKNLLRQEGFNVIEYKDIQPTEMEESVGAIRDLALRALELCKNVEIVYVGLDVNLHGASLQVAKIILNHLNQVRLLTGPIDDLGPMDENKNVIGAKYYIDAIVRWTKKEPMTMAKPGVAYVDLIKAKFNISDNSRVLMIGDNVETDIAFGANFGFKTCLVLTGLAKKENVDNWQDVEEHKPDYVATSLGEIYEKIKYM